MKRIVELPLITPVYSTHHNGLFSALLFSNPTIRNWYYTNAIMLRCNRKFLCGYTSPEINVDGLAFQENPYLEKKLTPMRFLKGYVKPVIRNLIDEGYYIHFRGVDDYYIEGKSCYMQRHMIHDGGICGYNQEDKTFCLYAYDINWIYRKFWTSQDSFMRGIYAPGKQGRYGELYGLKPNTNEKVEFCADAALNKISSYLDSSYEKYPEDGEGNVYGIIVHNYIAKYVGMLYNGSIPHNRMDWRTLRMIWEHKKVMLQRIKLIEQKMQLDNSISLSYDSIVSKANHARMLYASHFVKKRDELLPIIQNTLLEIKNKEEKLLTELLVKC